MFKIHPLYSSSSGNMFHIESGNTNIIIDAGVTYKAMIDGLKSINKDIADISAILITHEHIDHIKGLPLLCRKNDIPIYTCCKTAIYIDELLNEKNIKHDILNIKYGQAYKIGNIEFSPFETSHDAVMPCGYRINDSTKTISFATDLGYVSDDVMEALKGSDFSILESNYDSAMLSFGKYPYNLKSRIKSNFGHLSNDDAAYTMKKLYENGTNRFLLSHLSTNNNNTLLAKQTIEQQFVSSNIDDSSLDFNFASKELSCEEYIV